MAITMMITGDLREGMRSLRDRPMERRVVRSAAIDTGSYTRPIGRTAFEEARK